MKQKQMETLNKMIYYFKQQNELPKKYLVLNAFFVISIVAMVFVIYEEGKNKKEILANVVETVVEETPFDNLELGAKSAYVYDLANGKVLYKKNEFTQLPLASLTKLMMALTAVELVSKDSKVTIRREFLEEDGDTGLLANESWTLKDLLDFSLVTSSNDGARSVASVVGALKLQNNDYDIGRQDFVNEMNIKAEELGLKQTYFINESGLDEGSASGGYGSAIDVAKLLEYILINNPDLVKATRNQSVTVDSLSNKRHLAKNTNIDVNKIPGLLASKTGFTDSAGGNLAVAFDTSIGRPIIVVVLGSTQSGRFSDVSKLVDASYRYVQGVK